MTEQERLRYKWKSRLMSKRDQATLCDVNYSTFTRWLNGMEVNEITLNKITNGLKRLKNERTN